jgi:hypothetical protein
MNFGASAAIPACQLKMLHAGNGATTYAPFLSRGVKENRIASPKHRALLFAVVKHYGQTFDAHTFDANARVAS